MNPDCIPSLAELLRELLHGPPADSAAFVLNPGDSGLLKSLDALSSSDASTPTVAGGASIAAHVDHLCYGLHLLNRWSKGEEPFSTADYTASWSRGRVDENGWSELRRRLAEESDAWQAVVRKPPEMSTVEMTGVISSIVHLAYHLGAIRQIHPATRGPAAVSAPAS